jgi:response regulator RpfG family c-di-GMP phosphodiesterase
MEAEPVDLVVSDMRMPEMDGAGLLEQVCERWPTVGRILLTGYADVGSMVAAVNRGHIHRYVAKPWDDWDLLRSVQDGLERCRLEQENRKLLALTRSQNDKLQCLNAGLAARVKVRTTELEQVNAMLETSFAQLQQNFLLSIHVFAGLIERRAGGQAGYSRQVADLAQRIARRLDGGAMLERDVYIAGLLHEIGKIDFPETMLCKPLSAMTSDELALYRQHTLNGEAALQPLDQLRRVARYIRSYQERFDGKGFPDALSGEEVPLGAQILGIARDYYAAQSGRMALERSSPAEAHSLIVDGTGTRYEASIVEAFELALEDELIEKPLDRELPAHPLLPGMALSRDLQSGGSLRDEIRD